MGKQVKKLFSLVLAFILGFTILPSIVNAQGETERSEVKITDFHLSHNDENDSTDGDYGLYEQFKINMTWDASSYGSDLKEGDYFTITLSDNFYFESGSTFDVYDPNQENIVAKGVLTPTGNNQGGATIKVTFTNYVDGRNNIKGSLWALAKFYSGNVKTGEQNTFSAKIENGMSITDTVTIAPSGGSGEGELLAKFPHKTDQKDQVMWTVRINRAHEKLTGVVITDSIKTDYGTTSYREDSFYMRQVAGFNETGQIIDLDPKMSDVKISSYVTFNADKTSFTIEFDKMTNVGALGNVAVGIANGYSYYLMYRTNYDYEADATITNQINMESTTKPTQSQSETSYQAIDSAGGDGSGEPYGRIEVIKTDAATGKPLKGVTFEVKKDGDVVATLTTGEEGKARTERLGLGDYTVEEKDAPTGYVLDEEHSVKLVTPGKTETLKVENKSETIDITVTKKWEDDENQYELRPGSITVTLLEDGEKTNRTLTLSETNQWTDTFRGLPVVRDGEAITYSISEADVDNYTSTTSGSPTDGYLITNTLDEDAKPTPEPTASPEPSASPTPTATPTPTPTPTSSPTTKPTTTSKPVQTVKQVYTVPNTGVGSEN